MKAKKLEAEFCKKKKAKDQKVCDRSNISNSSSKDQDLMALISLQSVSGKFNWGPGLQKQLGEGKKNEVEMGKLAAKHGVQVGIV